MVATTLDAEAGTLRASCRSGGGLNLAEALIACGDLLIRHGGHRAAAGFDIAADRWPDFAERFLAIAAAEVQPAGPPELIVDLVLPADSVDYALVREIGLLAPNRPGQPSCRPSRSPDCGFSGFDRRMAAIPSSSSVGAAMCLTRSHSAGRIWRRCSMRAIGSTSWLGRRAGVSEASIRSSSRSSTSRPKAHSSVQRA